MAAIFTLDDGRSLYGSTMGMSGILQLTGEQLAISNPRLSRWLLDMSDRTAPFVDWDVRGLTPEDRSAFWNAAALAFDALVLKFGPDVAKQPNHWTAGCLSRLLEMKRRIDLGEDPIFMNDLSKPSAFSGEPIDLEQLWST